MAAYRSPALRTAHRRWELIYGCVPLTGAARRVPYIHVSTDDADLLRWSYLLQGPPDTPFAGGWYWGKLIFPPEYPFKPPRLEMATPSGRFQPNTRLCLSMSDYHPESWNPSWGLGTVLTGLLSFMVSNDRAEGAQNHLGAMQTSDAEKRKLAKASLAWNKKQAEFMTRFPLINALVAAASCHERRRSWRRPRRRGWSR